MQTEQPNTCALSLTHKHRHTLPHSLPHTHTSQSQCLLARFYGSLSLYLSLWASTLALLCRIISVVVVVISVVVSVPLQRTLAHYYYNNYILSILVFSLLLWFIFSGAQKHNKFLSNKMKIINKILLGIGGGEGKGEWVATGGFVWHLLCRRFITNLLCWAHNSKMCACGLR